MAKAVPGHKVAEAVRNRFHSCIAIHAGSGEGSARCVVHVDVHGECYVVGGCNVVANEHGR